MQNYKLSSIGGGGEGRRQKTSLLNVRGISTLFYNELQICLYLGLAGGSVDLTT